MKYTKDMISDTYDIYKTNNNLSETARITGINRKSIAENFDKYGFYYKKGLSKVPPLLDDETLREAYSFYLGGESSIKVSSRYNTNPSTILRGFKSLGLEIRSNKVNSRKYTVKNNNFFEEIDSPEKAYWLGFIYADGYISMRGTQKCFGFALSRIDEEIIHKLNDALDSDYPIGRYSSKGNDKYRSVEYSRLFVTDNKLVDGLISNGVLENKTNILKPPSLSDHLIRHFIRGYLDGDGSISKSLDSYYVGFLGTDDILLYISKYLLKNELIKGITKFSKRREGQIVSDVRYGGNIQAQKILDHLYEDSTIHLERKYNVYLKLLERNKVARMSNHTMITL